MFTYLWLTCRFLRSALRSRCDVALENLALRQRRLPGLHPSDRLFWSWLSRYAVSTVAERARAAHRRLNDDAVYLMLRKRAKEGGVPPFSPMTCAAAS